MPDALIKTNYGPLPIRIQGHHASPIPPAQPTKLPAPAVPAYRSKLERRYASHLEAQQRAGIIRKIRYEAIRLTLAPRTTYTPDFMVELPDGSLELHEVKGWMRDDANTKLKIAAALWGCFRFVLVRWEDGQWTTKPLLGPLEATP